MTQFTEQLHQLYKENGKLRKEEENKLLRAAAWWKETLFDQFFHMQNTHLITPLVD